ncbi:MAG: DUF2206 domain-containing protein, partial [Candidatus Bathyarchaeia archaeon]
SHETLLLVYLLVGASVFVARLKLRAGFADSFFVVLIGAVALSLFLSTSLSSPYMFGDDAQLEFALAQQVAQQGAWLPNVNILYTAALSVTILPAIISSVTSLDLTLIFKIVYPFIFSVAPMLLYRIYRKIVSPEAAFVSVFVFLSYTSTYVELMQLNREMIAELILVVLLWVQLSPTLRKMRPSSLLIFLLTIGLGMAHYSLDLIYILLVGVSFACSKIPRLRIRPLADLNIVGISLIVSLGWFFLAAGGVVLQTLTGDLVVVSASLSDFFAPTTRPWQVVNALGLSSVNTGILHLMNRGTQYLVLLCIIGGFLLFMGKRKKTRDERVLMPLMAICLGFLFASIAVPYLAGTFQISRIYQVALIVTAPCFYLCTAKITAGLEWLFTFVSAHRIRIRIGSSLAATILFSYLLFTSGWVWSVTSDVPTSLVLDQQRMANSSNLSVALPYYGWYTFSEDIAAAQWVRAYGAAGQLVCGDFNSMVHVLTSYGGYGTNGPTLPSECDFADQYVYLSISNSLLQVETTPIGPALLLRTGTFPLNLTSPTLFAENKVYSDGASIFANP